MTETYQDRKAARKERYDREHGVKMVTCTACSGSGYYDAGGSPSCGACGGTGKVRDRKATAKAVTS
jgi:DnaJ-class molecular chaperone